MPTEPKTVLLLCPACGVAACDATLLGDAIFASPDQPCLRCCECGTAWRVNLYEVEVSDGE